MEAVLSTQDLSKRFGSIKAVNNMNLEVDRGTVFGLLGPNGSGKTTTLGMLTGILNPSSGSFQWFGSAPSAEVRKKVGAIIEAPIFYPNLSGIKNLKIVCDIKGVDYSVIGDVLAFVGLEGRGGHRFKTYSLGMKQRLAIASALLSSPDVMILDEPTNGLDPQGIIEIRELIRKVASQGTSIILASHLLDEVQKVCSHVAIMKKGDVIYSGKVVDMTGASTVVEMSAERAADLDAAMRSYQGVQDMATEEGILVVTFGDVVDTAAINEYLAGQGIYLKHLTAREESLEEKFLEVLKEDGQ